MSSITLCAAALIASILALILKKTNAEYSLIITVFASTTLIIYVSSSIIDTIAGVREIVESASINIEYIEILLKCVGICFLTEFTADCCKDAGQAAISNIVVFGGRLLVILSALPFFTELMSTVAVLTGG